MAMRPSLILLVIALLLLSTLGVWQGFKRQTSPIRTQEIVTKPTKIS
jgi:hypothetical protein